MFTIKPLLICVNNIASMRKNLKNIVIIILSIIVFAFYLYSIVLRNEIKLKNNLIEKQVIALKVQNNFFNSSKKSLEVSKE